MLVGYVRVSKADGSQATDLQRRRPEGGRRERPAHLRRHGFGQAG